MYGKLNTILSYGFVEALWETIIALACGDMRQRYQSRGASQ
jgi:hypothetical protein